MRSRTRVGRLRVAAGGGWFDGGSVGGGGGASGCWQERRGATKLVPCGMDTEQLSKGSFADGGGPSRKMVVPPPRRATIVAPEHCTSSPGTRQPPGLASRPVQLGHVAQLQKSQLWEASRIAAQAAGAQVFSLVSLPCLTNDCT